MLTTLLTEWAQARFHQLFPEIAPSDPSITVLPSANPEFGDYQCNAAMALGKTLKKKPREIADAFTQAPDLHPSLKSLAVAGPGFINFTLSDAWLTERLTTLTDAQLGVPAIGKGKTILMDYGSPNISKPLHIGHLRSHNIGGALDRIIRFLGYTVIADNHLGDWGAQFGLTIRGYREFGDAAAMKARPLGELERVYVKSYELAQTDPAWKESCQQETVKLQQGDPENLKLWQQFINWSMEELDRTYKRLGIRYDIVHGESHYRNLLGDVVTLLQERGLVRESEGALVAFLEEEKLPVCIVRKRDGGFNYATTDIATVMERVREYNPSKIVYVTDERQQLHFRQFFAICKRLGYTVELEHVWFGLMRLPDATFSTREGNVIPLESLLDEAESRALKMVCESSPDMPADQQREVARKVGIGAVKYADLSQNPQSLVTFTWDKALALEGNSAPYLQYAHARMSSVSDKYRDQFPTVNLDNYPISLTSPIERKLVLHLLRFPEAVVLAGTTYRPNVLTDYLYELAQHYSGFYQNLPFLKAEEGIRESRIKLCAHVAKVLRSGLDLLGIEAPNRI
jgi:arginyl-tRNA synthetase